MKATELIERLQALIAEQGDCEVVDMQHHTFNGCDWEVNPNTIKSEFMLWN